MANELIQRLKLAQRALSGRLSVDERRSEIPAITEEEVAEARSFFPTEKYFIFGHARSGTTLLTRLIRLHPNVHCNYQAHFFTRYPLLQGLVADPEVGGWLSRRSNRWNRGKDLSPVVLRAASDFIMERDARQVGKAGPDFRVGDKSPNSLLNGQAVRLMVKIYPDARLLFIIRDGRDAVLSHRLQSFIDTPQSLSPDDLRIREEFTRNSEPFLSGQRSLFLEKNLRYEAQRWVENVTQTDPAGRELLGERYCHLRYEDLLASPWD
jgi:Sulfotransferase family